MHLWFLMCAEDNNNCGECNSFGLGVLVCLRCLLGDGSHDDLYGSKQTRRTTKWCVCNVSQVKTRVLNMVVMVVACPKRGLYFCRVAPSTFATRWSLVTLVGWYSCRCLQGRYFYMVLDWWELLNDSKGGSRIFVSAWVFLPLPMKLHHG